MSRKDYIAAAEIIAEAQGIADADGEATIVRGIADDLARMFARDNDRFDRSRFMRACGLES